MSGDRHAGSDRFTEQEWRALARSFQSTASVYDAVRPGHSAEALRWMVGDAARILDLGAGTGQLTREIVRSGATAIGVDPAPSMVERLRANLPEVEAYVGSAEAIPLPDASVDAVVAGQAAHWFDLTAAMPEMARVLRPGGRLGLVWNHRDTSVPWVVELSRVLDSDGPGHIDDRWLALLDAASEFGRRETAEFTVEQELDTDGLVALVSTRSYIATLPADLRDATLNGVRQLAETHPDIAEQKRFILPYITTAHRMTRI